MPLLKGETMTEPTKERFLERVKNHVLEIRKDEGVYRHIVMGIPGSGNMRYEIVTYPGCLCYSGDMGSYTFSRIDDMFRFFRQTDELKINTGYWHEKMDAEDRFSKSKVFDNDIFKQTLKQLLDDHFECESDDSNKAAIWADIESDILGSLDDGEVYARQQMDDFSSHGFDFQGCCHVSCDDYTYKFIWCLYAIVHAIMEYDKIKPD